MLERNRVSLNIGLLFWGLSLVLVVALWPFFQIDPLNVSVHSWTQSDRVALSLCFIDNGFDLFHPCTFNLMTKEGVTAGDLPFMEFVSALIMKFTGVKSFIVYKVFGFFSSLLVLWLLFRLLIEKGASSSLSILISLFLFFSPLYFIYSFGHLPSLFGLNFFLLGLIIFLRNELEPKRYTIIMVVLLMALSILIRKTFLISYLSFFFLSVVSFFKSKDRIDLKRVVLLFVGLCFFVSWNVYGLLLTQEYGSIFLSRLVPLTSVEEILFVVRNGLFKWGSLLVSPIQLIVVVFGSLLFLIDSFRKKLLFSKVFPIHFLLLNSCGVFLFFLLMGGQLVDHDYYYLDIFFVPFVVFLLLLTDYLIFKSKVVSKWVKVVFSITLLISIGSASCFSLLELDKRSSMQAGNMDQRNYRIFENSDVFLDQLNVEPNAKICVVGVSSTNGSLIQLKRKGYTLLNTSTASIRSHLSYDFQYYVISQFEYFNSLTSESRTILGENTLIGENYNLRVYLRGSPLAGAERKVLPLPFSFYEGFDLHANGMEADSLEYHLGTNVFGPSLKKIKEPSNLSPLLIRFEYFSDKQARLFLVDDTDQFGKSSYVLKVDSTSSWIQKDFFLPNPIQNGKSRKIYFFNPEMVPIKIRNLSVLCFK